MKYVLLFITINFCSLYVSAQKVDHLSSFRSITNSNYVRFNIDNDVFASLDQDYTQGINIELVLPALAKNPLTIVLPKFQNKSQRYGIAIEQIGFTPPNYRSPDIQEGERPFAGVIMLKSFNIVIDSIKNSQFTSHLSLGAIGSLALGEETQKGIHRITGNILPGGWDNQIRDDVILNYGIGYEQSLLTYSNIFKLNAQGKLNLGTLFTNASLGANTSLGILKSSAEIFKIYGFAQALVTTIAYDATLQGGLLNKNSPYTIASNDIERLTGQFHFGAILNYKKFYLEVSRSFITREFEQGNSAKWGSLRFGIGF